MQFSFDLDAVRMISIDGNTVRLDLSSGFVEVTFDSREVMDRVLRGRNENPAASRHVIYENGIFGI